MILTIGPGGCGFTFLNWSISYLRGDEFYQCLNGTVVPVPDNPLRNSTAHGFDKDHLRLQDSRFEMLKNCHHKSIIYMIPHGHNDFEYILSLSGKKIIFDSSQHTQSLMSRHCLTIADSAYMDLINQLSVRYPRHSVIEVFLDVSDKLDCNYRVPSGYFTLSFDQIFQSLDQQIHSVMQHVELEIQPCRWDNWHNIYQIYKSRNQNFVQRLQGHTVVSSDRVAKTQILKEILKWRDGRYQIT